MTQVVLLPRAHPNASISHSTYVVSPASMDTDSCESDAAEDLLHPYPGKNRTTDRDVGPSRRKYTISQTDETFTLAQTFRNKTCQFEK